MTEITDIAVLAARFNTHEQGCDQRMLEIRDTFKEVKADTKNIQNLIMGLLISIAGASIILLVTIILTASKLT